MAIQDLAYQITVNDAQLRLATQNVAAFNAEIAASTVTGRRLDENLRSIGRRTAQVGSFFIRNLTIPLGLAGFAAGKLAANFETSLAKIQGLTSTSAADTQKLGRAALALGSSTITQGPAALADAEFRLQSVGFKTNQTIAALKPIAEAAAAGLGNTAIVADAVASALDAYGIAGQNAGKNALSASKATAVLIGTVTKGKIAPEQLAQSIGRVIPLANAMGLSFDQVGASIASMTRQGLNANLATTGLRALLNTFTKAQPQSQKAFAAIGTSNEAVAESIKTKGLFPTVIALRDEFDKLGKHPIKIDTKTLAAGLNGEALALAKIKAEVGGTNQALAHAFPNIRALTSFLILTGPRRQQNATIFATLKQDVIDSQDTVKKAYEAKLRTPIGQLDLQISKLKTTATEIGPAFIQAGTGILHFLGGIIGLVQGLGPLKGLFKDIGIGLLIFGPIVSLLGRAAQAASFGVLMWGRWSEAATRAAYAANGVNIAEAEQIIAQKKATVQFVELEGQKTAAINRTAAALRGQGALAIGGARGAVVAASGGTARITRASGGLVAAGALAGAASTDDLAGTRLSVMARQAQAGLTASVDTLLGAQLRYQAAVKTGIPNQIAYAKAEVESAAAAAKLATANSAVLFPADERLLALTTELAAAQNALTIAQQTGAGASIAQARVLTAETAILARQRALAGVNTVGPTGGGFALVDSRATELQAGKASAAALTAGRITATGWGKSVEAMKGVAKLGFDFIAITFAVDLAQKIIFSSHQTRDAVTKDLFDINKAGIGTFSAIGVIGAFALPRLMSGARALSGAGGLKAGLEAAGVGAIGLRGKIGLLLASVLGLQAAGVHLESIFNAVFAGLAVKSVLSSRIMQGAVAGLLGRAGFAGLAAGIGEVGLGVVALPAAFAIASTEIITHLSPVKKALAPITDFLFKHHLEPHIGFLGPLSPDRLDRPFTSAAQKMDAIKKKTQDLTNVSDLAFKALSKGLPASVVAAATTQRDLGHEYAAEQLLAASRAKQQFDEVKSTVAFLRAHGKDALANLLDPVSTKLKELKAQFDSTFTAIETSVLNAFDNRTARMLDAFDAQTTVLGDKLKTLVNVPGLKESFTVTVSGKTPAERELDALDRVGQKRQFLRDEQDARRALGQASLIGDPTAIRAALRQEQDAETARRRFILEGRAKTERTAADAAIKAHQTSFSNERAAARRDLEATRTVAHDQLKASLDAQQKMFDSGKIKLKKYYEDILRIMRDNNISIAQAGHDGGAAYAKQLGDQLDKLKTKIDKDMNAMATKARTTAAAIKKGASNLLGLLNPSGAPGVPGLPFSFVVTPVTPGGTGDNQYLGLPTRKQLLSAIQQLPHGTYEAFVGRENAAKAVPKSERINYSQYQEFLAKVPGYERRVLEGILQQQGFFFAATGGWVPGTGTRDTVPAMLTPGELVLNARQQDVLKRLLGLDSHSGLFDLLSSASHFAGGGTVGGPNLPTVPGFKDVTEQIKRLVKALATASARIENAPNNKALAFGITADDSGALGRVERAQARRAARALLPTSIESLVSHDSALKGLSGDRKRELEQSLARLQAHPVSAGLITTTLRGATVGSSKRLPGEAVSVSSGAPGGGGLRGTTFTGPIYINVDGSRGGRQTAQEIRRELQNEASRNVDSRRANHSGTRMGVG